MESGSELDALIEEKVFGRRWELVPRVKINDTWREYPTWICVSRDSTAERPELGSRVGQRPPRYSEEIAAAWTVVEKMDAEAEWGVQITLIGGNTICEVRQWSACNVTAMGKAKTAPEAICKAALIWAERKKEEGNDDE